MKPSNHSKANGITSTLAGDLSVHTPIDGSLIAKVRMISPTSVPAIVQKINKGFEEWKEVPAPVRGELVRILGEELREAKENLAQLVTLEAGKILSEGRGEVQEMIDICDYAVGLSRQLFGLTIASERAGHHMRETWHPLGPVAVITLLTSCCRMGMECGHCIDMRR